MAGGGSTRCSGTCRGRRGSHQKRDDNWLLLSRQGILYDSAVGPCWLLAGGVCWLFVGLLAVCWLFVGWVESLKTLGITRYMYVCVWFVGLLAVLRALVFRGCFWYMGIHSRRDSQQSQQTNNSRKPLP